MNRDELEKELKQLIADSKILFGDVEEMDKDELRAMLDEPDRSPEVLCHSMWSAVEKACTEIRLRGDIPPRRYAEVLNQLRPASQPSAHANVLIQQAHRWIRELLSGVRSSSESSLQFSFRNKGKLSQEDRRILDEAEAEVRRKIERIR
jgi:hypothetical protein